MKTLKEYEDYLEELRLERVKSEHSLLNYKQILYTYENVIALLDEQISSVIEIIETHPESNQ